MDATRSRRTRDAARQRWYAACRCRRFARFLGLHPSFASSGKSPADPRRPERNAG